MKKDNIGRKSKNNVFSDRRNKFARRLTVLLCVTLAGMAVLSGCEKKETDTGALQISYINKSQTQVVEKGYEPTADLNDTEALIMELLDVLATDSEDVEYVKPIPDDVKIKKFALDQGNLILNFNKAYKEMEPVREILCRLAIVKTLTQIDGVDSVEIHIGKSPLQDSKGRDVGKMTDESFVESPGEQLNSIQQAKIDLFYANKKGDGLVKETQNVYYSSNLSLEKLVVEHLLDGPQSTEGAQSPLPNETELLNVSVVDGVCYVNFDDGFMTQNYEIQEQVVIYSLVDSLTALANVNEVQISVNGNTNMIYRDSYSLSALYKSDMSLVEKQDSRSVIVNDVEEGNTTGE